MRGFLSEINNGMAKFNKGDISEGILAAAIACRFLSKTAEVKFEDVISIIKKLKKPVAVGGSLVSTSEFNSPNKISRITDRLTVVIGLAPVNMVAFLNPTIYKNKDIIELVQAAVAYSNGSFIKEAANELYNNNQKNHIEISSQGLLDQTGTKVDLKIIVDGRQVGVGISLKAGDVKQFGQVGGATTEAMKEFFEPLGVKFTNVHLTKFQDLVADKKTAEALTYMYKESYTQISRLLKTNQEQFKKNLSKFVLFHATRNEPNVALVQLSRNEAYSYDFSKLKNKLRGIILEVKYEESITEVIPGKKIPKLKITAKGGAVGKDSLIELRNKLEGNRINSKGKMVGLTVRNYVEKGHLTSELLAEKYG